jgi:hypothetical protein
MGMPDLRCTREPGQWRRSALWAGFGLKDPVGLTQGDNVAILVHGVSLSSRGSGRLDTRLDTPPISFRHHPVSRIAPEGLAPVLNNLPKGALRGTISD